MPACSECGHEFEVRQVIAAHREKSSLFCPGCGHWLTVDLDRATRAVQIVGVMLWLVLPLIQRYTASMLEALLLALAIAYLVMKVTFYLAARSMAQLKCKTGSTLSVPAD